MGTFRRPVDRGLRGALVPGLPQDAVDQMFFREPFGRSALTALR